MIQKRLLHPEIKNLFIFMSFKKNLEDLGFVPRFSDMNDTGFLNTDYYYFIKRSTLSRAEICLEILRYLNYENFI